jgi:hypothetical protein
MLTRKAMFLGLFGVALAAFSLQHAHAAAHPAAAGGSARPGHAQDVPRPA